MAPLIPQTDNVHEEILNATQQTPIQHFYANKSIFITGATGFLGKILIDKLLRDCNIETIYVLARAKKGKDIHTRVDDMFDDPLFERLKAEQPKFRHKISVITGDCNFPELGISPEERIKLQQNVQIVFHVAATVRFDEKLKLALSINVVGTRELLNLCRGMDNLHSVVHVSTAFANCYNQEIYEKFYKTELSGENAIKLANCLDEHTLDAITPALIHKWPNTYTFTKCLAEDLVRTSCKGLPLAVFRPAIVIPTYREPTKGWIDNMYGPTGIVVGCGAGLLRVLNCKQENNAEIVPVDLCVNSIIASAWDVAQVKYDEPPIYNFVTSTKNSINWQTYCQLSTYHGNKIPFSKSVWYYRFTMTSNFFLVCMMKFFYHLVPAFLMDVGLLLMGKKPKMLAIYKKIHRFCDVITYFTSRKWYFSNENVKLLYSKLNEKDKELFYFDMDSLDWNDFLKHCMHGVRRYLLKDDPSTIEYAIKRNQRLKVLHYTVIYSVYGFLLYVFYLMLCKIINLI